MATTSLWHIKGRLKDLIDYVENPEKTKAKAPELQDLYNVFSYVQRPEATQEGEYVTAINCLKETALRQMILTKKRYGKTDGYIAWHGYQSFKPEEVTPQLAHEIGVKLAKEMWGDRFEIIVTTHLDKEHILSLIHIFLYELQGDYYLPCLKLPEDGTVHIGIWGQRHRRYLKTHRKTRSEEHTSELQSQR